MRCPKCGFEQPDLTECGRCGVIVSRWRGGEPPQARPVRSAPATMPRPPASGTSRALLALALLAVVGLGVLILRGPRSRSQPPATTQAASEAPFAHGPGVTASALPVDIPVAPLPSY